MARVEKPGRKADQFPLRLPEGMRTVIKERAGEEGVSMNDVIIQTLHRRFFENDDVRRTILRLMKYVDYYLDGQNFIAIPEFVKDVRDYADQILEEHEKRVKKLGAEGNPTASEQSDGDA